MPYHVRDAKDLSGVAPGDLAGLQERLGRAVEEQVGLIEEKDQLGFFGIPDLRQPLNTVLLVIALLVGFAETNVSSIAAVNR